MCTVWRREVDTGLVKKHISQFTADHVGGIYSVGRDYVLKFSGLISCNKLKKKIIKVSLCVRNVIVRVSCRMAATWSAVQNIRRHIVALLSARFYRTNSFDRAMQDSIKCQR